VALLVREVGKVRDEAFGDASGAVSLLRYFASLADELAPAFGDGMPADVPLPGRAMVRHLPIGPVAIIAPWNTPIYLTFMALAPALLAGNTAVVKPPEEAPLALSDALAVLAENLPLGVVGVLPGLGAETGNALTSHPGIRKILFTGSIETGRTVMRNAAGHIAAVGMELGGNDPAILLDDVVIDAQLLRELVAGVFGLSGQICYNVKRIYVHESRIAEFVAAFTAVADRLVVGDPTDSATTIGPVTTRAGRDRLETLVESARAAGADVVEVGHVPADDEFARGNYVRPTVVTGLSADHPLVVEEQFGPIIPIIPFASDDEAVALANGTKYGLAASVWSPDRDRAWALARRIQAGSAFVNVHRVGASPMSVPFGGVKQSGLGRNHGPDSVLACTEPQSLVEFEDPGQIPGAARWAALTEENDA
jgi:aldehyde dehydrogenase